MSDEGLRAQERAFREGGSEETELAWLRGRARAGQELDWASYSRLSELASETAGAYLRWRVEAGRLEPEALSLLALCNHDPAGSAPDGLAHNWWEVVPSYGARATVWVGMAAARSVLPVWEDSNPEDGRPRAAVEAAESWCLAPSATSAEVACSSWRPAGLAGTEFLEPLQAAYGVERVPEREARPSAAAYAADLAAVLVHFVLEDPARLTEILGRTIRCTRSAGSTGVEVRAAVGRQLARYALAGHLWLGPEPT